MGKSLPDGRQRNLPVSILSIMIWIRSNIICLTDDATPRVKFLTRHLIRFVVVCSGSVRKLLLLCKVCLFSIPHLESAFGSLLFCGLGASGLRHAGNRLVSCGLAAREIGQPIDEGIGRHAKMKRVWRRSFPGRRHCPEKRGRRTIRLSDETAA